MKSTEQSQTKKLVFAKLVNFDYNQSITVTERLSLEIRESINSLLV